ncbi:hypothetical protein [Gordonia sp. WA4-43]|uniref:hypothetical protein n=1 Tax=Gordonia sp. WA4-43 TaxID=2878678 RepID=UPI001CFC29A8|nr:hypothetical protein [Gordonia sp. WA4-43]UCZ88648.1 hypothetical protein LEL84_16380 [Gordonia sp. WA4-43]
MNPETAVLDAIDALVDEQLQQEASGWDHNINQPHCPHAGCQARWHGLPHARCPGSAVQGPLKPPIWPARSKAAARVSIIDADGNQTPIRGAVIDFQITPPTDDELVTAWEGVRQAFQEAGRQFTIVLQNVSDEMRNLLGVMERAGIPVDAADSTPQQRALPRPSHTPPMWAARADGRKRR